MTRVGALLLLALMLVAACDTRLAPTERVVSRKPRLLGAPLVQQNAPQPGSLELETGTQTPGASGSQPVVQRPASVPVAAVVASNPIATAGVNPNPVASNVVASNTLATSTVEQNPVASTPVATPVVVPNPVASLSVRYRDAQPGTWMPWQPLMRPRAGLVAAVLGGTLAAVEGHPRSSQEEWDAQSLSWVLREHPGEGLGTKFAAAALDGEELYLAGGIMVGRSALMQRYAAGFEPAVLGELPDARKAAAAGFFDGDLYLFGGETSAGATADRRRVDFEAREVSVLAGMSYAVAGAASVQLGARVWLLGGYTTDANGLPQAISTVGVYDHNFGLLLRSGSGVTGAPPPLPEARHSAAAARDGNRIFVAGGAGAAGGLLDTVLVLDTAAPTPAWQVLTRLPTPRALLALVVYDGWLLAIGGHGADRRPQTRVEAYRL